MISRKKLFAIVLLVAVSVGYAVKCGHASLVCVAESHIDELDFGVISETNSSQEPEIPKQFDKSVDRSLMNTSMTVSNTISGSGNVSILMANICFCVPRSHSDLVYMLGWLWLPRPPCDDLLKVPISG